MLGGKHFLNWRNHASFAFVALLTAILFDADRLGGKPTDWLWFALLGIAITVGALEAIKPLIKRIETNRSLVLAIALPLVGLLRGASLFLVGSSAGLLTDSDIIYRLIGAPLFVFFSYLISSAVFEPYLNFKEQSAELREETLRLEQAKSSYAQDLLAFNEQQRVRVRELLSPPIWELQKKLEEARDQSAVQDALIRMQALNNEIVRPLSHQLAAEAVSSQLDSPQRLAKKKVIWPKTVDLHQNLPTGFFLLVSSSLGFSSQITSAAASGFILASVVLSTALLIFQLERLIFKGRRLPTVVAIFLTVAMGFLAGLAGSAVASALGLETGENLPILAASYLAVAKLFTISYSLVQRSWIGALEELRNVAEELKKVNSWLRQQLWLGQKSLAMELHGSVQSTLHAMASKLSKMQEVSKPELEEVVAVIRESLSRIENEEYLAGGSFHSLLTDLKELWDGTAQITWNIGPDAQEILERDLGLARCLFEVIRETVVNSVKHGEAENISIQVEAEGSEIQLRVINDGKLVERNPGGGDKLFNQICLEHDIKSDGAGVKFSAQLAISL